MLPLKGDADDEAAPVGLRLGLDALGVQHEHVAARVGRRGLREVEKPGDALGCGEGVEVPGLLAGSP